MQDPSTSSAPKPPVARVAPTRLEKHGDVRVDDYHWLNQREDPEVIAYLEQENAYTEAATAHTARLRDALFEEIKGRIPERDESVPYRLDDYYYYTRFVEGAEYAIHCRKKESLEGYEEVVLDGNALAEGHEFFSMRGPFPSPQHDLVAFGTDTVGRRKYTLRFVDLSTGEALPDAIPDVTGNLAWAMDNKTVFYTVQDPVTLRSYRVYRHELGTDPAQDELVYEETDDTFSVGVSRTKSRKYMTITSRQTLRTEVRYLPADEPTGEWKVFTPRETEHRYSVDHLEDRWIIRTNDQAQNFRMMWTPVGDTAKASWQELVAHCDDVYLTDFSIFRDFLVLGERKDGVVKIRVMPWEGRDYYIAFRDPTYRADLLGNPMLDSDVVRYSYTSLTTPLSTFDFNMKTGEGIILKREKVLGGFDSADYRTERLDVEARDGTTVPVSIVRRREVQFDGTAPLLLYGYGSYGSTVDASFRSSRLSLIDRGFVFAIAHVRGGQMLGRSWYEDGKLFKKKNTFTDFVDVAKALVEKKYAAPDRIFAEGHSAGGLLVGAVLNMEPGLFRGVIAGVPFVDVVTTMLDDSIPLTTSEYDEWGNPNDEKYYRYMKSYSPYDNVAAADYCNILVTTGLHDSQVQYWEPAKWVAKLRASKTGDNLLLLKTNMEAGHGGASGRFKRYEEIAFQYAFLLDLAGIAQ